MLSLSYFTAIIYLFKTKKNAFFSPILRNFAIFLAVIARTRGSGPPFAPNIAKIFVKE
jgi:hypothetical protein